MDNNMIGIIVIILTVLVARYAQNQALKELNALQKLELVGISSKFNRFSMYFLIGLMVAYYFVMIKQYLSPTALTISFFTVLFGYMAVQVYVTHTRLKKHEFPKEYIQKYLLANLIRVIGMVAFIVVLSI